MSELSLASRTGWLDLARRDWWDEALAWSGARRPLLPELVASGEPVGTAHDRWGVPGLGGAALTVAGHDHQAAAIGADAARVHAELDSCGTAEAYVRTVPPGLAADDIRALTDAEITVGWHALAEHWCLLGATRGGLVLQRVLALLGRGRADLAALDAAALRSSRARWSSRAPTAARSVSTRSATTSTRPGSGGPPSPPPSTRAATSTTPCPAPAAPTRTSS